MPLITEDVNRHNIYDAYNHPDNWMSSEEAKHITDMEASEKEEQEWEQRQKELDDFYASL